MKLEKKLYNKKVIRENNSSSGSQFLIASLGFINVFTRYLNQKQLTKKTEESSADTSELPDKITKRETKAPKEKPKLSQLLDNKLPNTQLH